MTMRTLIIIPTYNEKDNIKPLLVAISDLKQKNLEVLVVDDSSPDGTGKIVEKLTKTLSLQVHLLTRTKKQGLGAAYMDGFKWALDRKYQYVVSMDADFSHSPDDLSKLLDASSDFDMVIGSRYIPGGKIIGWGTKRYLNSVLANWITRMALSLKPHDVTAGFKRYSRHFLQALNFKHIIASGYAFQVEMVFNAQRRGFKITEVPITFVDRRVGQSKISGELKRSAAIIWRLFLRREGIRQFVKFCVVGAINTVVDWVLFSVFRIPLAAKGQTGKQLSKAGSFVIAAISSYIMNRKWTFRSTDKKLAKQAGKFFVISLVGLSINNVIFYYATSPGGLKLKDIYGLIIATAGATMWNFLGNKHWTFK